MLKSFDDKQAPPMPIKNAVTDHILYSKDGTIRPQFLKICTEVGLNPDDLTYRAIDEFKGPKISYNIQVIRYNHFENKRQGIDIIL